VQLVYWHSGIKFLSQLVLPSQLALPSQSALLSTSQLSGNISHY